MPVKFEIKCREQFGEAGYTRWSVGDSISRAGQQSGQLTNNVASNLEQGGAWVSDQQRLADHSEKLLKKGEGIVGELGDDLLQDKGELLPREYRRVIEQYLTIISEMENSERQQQDLTK